MPRHSKDGTWNGQCTCGASAEWWRARSLKVRPTTIDEDFERLVLENKTLREKIYSLRLEIESLYFNGS